VKIDVPGRFRLLHPSSATFLPWHGACASIGHDFSGRASQRRTGALRKNGGSTVGTIAPSEGQSGGCGCILVGKDERTSKRGLGGGIGGALVLWGGPRAEAGPRAVTRLALTHATALAATIRGCGGEGAGDGRIPGLL